ncbi:hypothetical protein ED312_22420 [Sinomicrobium pectinilyticum]|uniref:Uncharacterized protein n=1 Tax=Sinomicrobium pectinilyticum TaxID=1084421 RepID=A0A3N0D0R0_SINP1|nr:hypothetical protein [Sinomicrobium pectinilyticum]RNL69238.1 hypothetical protein ED312_22420 [Sinomicrobium pectinilyticum]
MRKTAVFFILSLVLASCTTPKKTNTDLISHIPENTSIVVKISNPQAFFNALKNNDFLKSNTLIPPGLSKKLEPLRVLDKKSEALLCIIRNTDSIYDFAYISRDTDNYSTLDSLKGWKTESSSLNKIPIKQASSEDHSFFNTVIDSIFIASSSEPLMEQSILGGNTAGRAAFRKVYELANKDKQASFFLRNHPFYPGNLTLSDSTAGIQSPAGWAMFDISLSPGELLLTGIVPAKDSIPGTTSIPVAARKTTEITPADAEGMLSLAPYDFSLYKDSLTDVPVRDLLTTADEVGIIYGENHDVVTFHTFDSGVAEKAFSGSAVLQTTFREHNIYKIDSLKPFAEILPPFGKGNAMRFYTAVDNYIVLGSDPRALADIITNYQNQSTLEKRTSFTDMMKSLPDASSMLAVGITPKYKELFLEKMLSGYHDDLSFSSPDDFPYLVVQGIADKNFTHTNLLLQKPGKAGISTGISEKFNIALDADIAIPPQLVTNHLNKEKEVVVQDMEHNLYLISNEGKVLWKKKLNARILGKIEQVDILRNGKLQLAFALPDGIYVIDRNSNDVSPFPVKVQAPITKGLAVFDYDNNKKYRLFITQENIIVPFDSNGKRVKGFDFSGTQSAILNPPEHFRTGTRDYIAVQEENGTLHLLHRTGKSRVNVKGNIDFSANRLYLYQDKFTTTNSDGDLIQVDERGGLNKIALGLAKDHHIATTSRTLATLSDNILTIKQNKYELDYGIYTGPDIFYINNKIYVALTDIQAKKVYLFDSNAVLLSNFPVYGTSAIDLADMDGNGKLEFVTQGEKDKVIVYEIR